MSGGTSPKRDSKTIIAHIEARVAARLGRRIAPEENFFEAGLTSMFLTELHDSITREYGVALPITALFRHPHLRALDAFLAAGGDRPGPPQARGDTTERLRRLGRSRQQMRSRIRDDEGRA